MNNVSIGMVGAGRAAELHTNALTKISGIPIRLKTIVDNNKERLHYAKERYNFETASNDFDALLKDPDVHVIDICTPPYAHEDMIIRALNAGKHVICEKPLTGYFGMDGDKEPVGTHVSKAIMYEKLIESIARLQIAIDGSPGKFMYAENFVYAPAVIKAAAMITAKKSRILYMKAEESLKGSSSPVAGQWSKTGGGTFIRTGTHPLSALLWLKEQEARAHGITIKAESVIADMGRVTSSLTDYEHRHIAARPYDVEDNGTAIITFSDQSKALIIATDVCLGGSKNEIDLYCNDAHISCKLTLNDLMSSYFLDEDGLDDTELSEMLPSKTGWNKPFIADELIRGYVGEMQDFMESIYYNREPKSGFKLACDTVKIIYAAYKSAELGKRITID